MAAVWYPTLETVGRPQICIPFNATLGAGAVLTLVSGRIPFRFRITRVAVALGALPAVTPPQIRIFTSANLTVTAGVPTDPNALAQYSPTPWVTAVNTYVMVDLNFIADEGDRYIKVYFDNLDVGATLFAVIVFIERAG